MTYSTINELPDSVRNALSPNDCETWMNTYNRSMNEYGEGTLTIPDYALSPEMYARELAWESTKYADSSRYVEAVVSTEVVDAQGDLADVDAYVGEGQNFINNGGIGIGDHTNKVSLVVWKVYKGVDATSDKPCVIARLNFFRGRILYDKLWSEFRAGKTQWSIGSLVTSQRECNSGKCYNRIKPAQWFELSNVHQGINPLTYPVDYNESAKGLPGVLDMHDEVCPILKKYLAFKGELSQFDGITANAIEGGVILVHGKDIARAKGLIDQNYADCNVYEVGKGDHEHEHGEEHEGHEEHEHEEHEEDEGEECYLIMPHPIDDSLEMLDAMIALIKDEKEAIEGYVNVLKSLSEGAYLDTPGLETVTKVFNEIIHDEEEHIGGVIETIKLINPEMGASLVDGAEEAIEEADKGCPAGQHEHAGVWGCHDIFREHSVDHNTTGTDALDLTDEQINAPLIQKMPTDKLKMLVVKVAKTLLRYSDSQRQKFLATTPGKEFVLMFLELKRRGKQENNTMSEKEAGCTEEKKAETVKEAVKAEVPEVPIEEPQPNEANKGSPPDVLTSIATIASTLASMTSVIDQINIRMMKVEEFMASSSENKTDITDAIMGGAGGSDSMLGGSMMQSPPVEDASKDIQSATVGSDAGGIAQDNQPNAEEDNKPPFAKDGETKEEGSDEKSEEPKSEGDSPKETSSDDKKEDASEDKKEEDSKEPAKDDSESKDEKKDKPPFDKKKGEEMTEEEVVTENLVDAKKGEDAPEPVVAEAPAEVVAEAPVEEVKAEVPGAEPVADVPPAEPVVEPKAVVSDDKPLMPPGGGIDFKSAWAKRRAELRTKGVDFNLPEDNVTISLANESVSEATKGGVHIIEPTGRIGVFDGIVGGEDNSIANVMKKNLGTNPKNFLDSFKRGIL